MKKQHKKYLILVSSILILTVLFYGATQLTINRMSVFDGQSFNYSMTRSFSGYTVIYYSNADFINNLSDFPGSCNTQNNVKNTIPTSNDISLNLEGDYNVITDGCSGGGLYPAFNTIATTNGLHVNSSMDTLIFDLTPTKSFSGVAVNGDAMNFDPPGFCYISLYNDAANSNIHLFDTVKGDTQLRTVKVYKNPAGQWIVSYLTAANQITLDNSLNYELLINCKVDTPPSGTYKSAAEVESITINNLKINWTTATTTKITCNATEFIILLNDSCLPAATCCQKYNPNNNTAPTNTTNATSNTTNITAPEINMTYFRLLDNACKNISLPPSNKTSSDHTTLASCEANRTKVNCWKRPAATQSVFYTSNNCTKQNIIALSCDNVDYFTSQTTCEDKKLNYSIVITLMIAVLGVFIIIFAVIKLTRRKK